MNFKTALISGVGGQDGSYLAEHLLSLGYTVSGILRNSQTNKNNNIKQIKEHMKIYEGDILDNDFLKTINYSLYDEFYHLAAQSHVGLSFTMPNQTWNTNYNATLNLLDKYFTAKPNGKFYFAATSELFGRMQAPQNENTPFDPVSPYSKSKYEALKACRVFRNNGKFVSAGILYNHETLAGNNPMIFKQNNIIDIKPICEIVQDHTRSNELSINESELKYQEGEPNLNLEVWDANGWTKVKYFSAYPHDIENNNKNPKWLISKNAAYHVTANHEIIMEDKSEKKCSNIEINDKVNILNLPDSMDNFDIPLDFAELLGMIAADGYINRTRENLGRGLFRITSKDKESLLYWEGIIKKYLNPNNIKYNKTKSGFKPENEIWQLEYFWREGDKGIFEYSFYCKDKKKRIPYQILNSNKEVKKSFLIGYYKGDGLKSGEDYDFNKYFFRRLKTNSAVLAQGLLFLLKEITNQEYNINIDRGFFHNEFREYYIIDFLSNNSTSNNKNIEDLNNILPLLEKDMSYAAIGKYLGIDRKRVSNLVNNRYKGEANKGLHNKKANNAIKKIIDTKDNYSGWFYDLETESGTFHAGIGQGHIHNSPRRGDKFVTQKIIQAIKKYKEDKNNNTLILGNLDAKRDWGYAKDYCEAMHLMLQHNYPDEFIIATNKTYSIKDFILKALKEANIEKYKIVESVKELNLDFKEDPNTFEYMKDKDTFYILQSKDFYRPNEVDVLQGDYSKARDILGWSPKTSLDELIKIMLDG